VIARPARDRKRTVKYAHGRSHESDAAEGLFLVTFLADLRNAGAADGSLSNQWLTRLAAVVTMAAAYFVAAKLGLLLGIPAGYAAVVWPAAGISLAGILIYGYRIAPGIFLGSVLLNVWTGFDSLGSTSIADTWVVAVSIGLGASLQATLGAFLIRRFGRYPTGFLEAREVVNFLLLGGPVSCLVNATWSVTTLALAGVIAWSDYLYQWWAWWMRNSVGVVTVATLVLVWLGEPPHFSRRRQVFVSVPLFIALVLLITASSFINQWNQNRMKSAFVHRTDYLAYQLKNNFDNFIDVLHSLESLYAISNSLTAKDFNNFVSYWFLRYPAIRTLAWNPVVRESERAFYEQAARAQGLTNFEIKEVDAHGELVRAGRRPEYFPVLYLETRNGNKRALGFDSAADLTRRETLDWARDSGKPTATGQTRLIRDLEKEPVSVVFMPLFKSAQVRSVTERRRDLRGYISGAFRIRDIINSVQKGGEFSNINIRLSRMGNGPDQDLPNGARAQVINPKRAAIRPQLAPVAPMQRTVTFHSAERNWVFEFTPNKAYLVAEGRGQTWVVLGGGLIMTGLLSAFLLSVTGHIVKINGVNARLREEIYERALAEEKVKNYAVIVDSLNQAIIGSTWGGNITNWNKGATNMYGYTAEEVIGRSISLLHPPDQPDELARMHGKLKRGEPVSLYETMRRRKDGTQVEVALTLAPIKDTTGKITGVASISQDISERRRVERALQQQREEVAGRLHDSVAQSLTALSIHVELATRQLSDNPAKAKDSLQKIKQILNLEQLDLRAFLCELKGAFRAKPSDNHNGLTALKNLIERLESQWGLTIESKIDERMQFISGSLLENICFLIQEGVANAARHGHAASMCIAIDLSKGALALSIADNGQGFPFRGEYDDALLTVHRIGPMMLRNRVASLGGSLSLHSTDYGACLEISLPLGSFCVN
jgi:PAS domain S-box-containing protein